MQRIWAVAWLLGVGAAVVCGCSSSDDAAPKKEGTGTKKTGEPCTFQTDCAEGDCDTSGLCTKPCSKHSDCGCPVGTTDSDITKGACALACTFDKCMKVCDTVDDCKPAQCTVPNPYYSVCD